jgi:hypothetical protein
VRRRLALGYFLVQALAVAAWWGLLTVWPRARPLFTLYGAPPAALAAFAPGDLGLVALGSALVALGRGRGRTGALAWVVAGAMAYAAAYAATAALTGASGPLGALLMLPAAAASLVSAGILTRTPRDESLPTRPAA